MLRYLDRSSAVERIDFIQRNDIDLRLLELGRVSEGYKISIRQVKELNIAFGYRRRLRNRRVRFYRNKLLPLLGLFTGLVRLRLICQDDPKIEGDTVI